MLTVSIPNQDDFDRWITNHYKKQIPYATSRAINQCLWETQIALMRHYKAKGHKAWYSKAANKLRVKKAHKKQLFLAGEILIDIYWGHLQQHGGTKRPFKSKYFPVPTRHAPQYLRKAGGIKRAMKVKSVFMGRTKKGTPILMKKFSKTRIETLAVFTDRARIKPNLDFYRIAEKVARRRFHKHLNKFITQAIRTSK